MKKLIYLLLFIFISSCNKVEFVYNNNENLINPLYEKTDVNTSGVDLAYISSYIPMYFGKNKQDIFSLLINIDEEKTKRSVETNQAASNLRYELGFSYTLKSKTKSCIVFKKRLLSYFTIIPKSEGYNYGSDVSLEKKYELAINDNLDQFISLLSGVDLSNCK